eukprot:3920809-Pyramimonas_sp.AAC.1
MHWIYTECEQYSAQWATLLNTATHNIVVFRGPTKMNENSAIIIKLPQSMLNIFRNAHSSKHPKQPLPVQAREGGLHVKEAGTTPKVPLDVVRNHELRIQIDNMI